MHSIITDIEIRASPAGIWSILTDFPAYPRWNPFIRSIAGSLVASGRLTVSIQPPGGRARTFRPRVMTWVENRELRWRGRLLSPGLFDGEHFFRIEAKRPGLSRFVHGEQFSGLLVPLVRSRLESGTRAGFVAMNQALKSRAEHA